MKTIPLQPFYSLIYTRVSSKNQKYDGSGDASQEVRCMEYSNSKGYIYEKTFEDVFTGGGNYMNRKGMVGLLRYIDEHKDKRFVVIFDDLKRFARDVKFHITLREELAKRKARVESPNFHFDDSPEGEANELYTAVSNQLERKQNQRQVIQKQTARLVDGYWPFNAPKGYTMRKVDGCGKVLFPNYQADFIKEALEGFANLKFNQIDIARFLKEKGVFGKQPAERYLDAVLKMLQNVIYAGYIEFQSRGIERKLGKHEGIITLDTYEVIQRRLVRPDGKRIRCDLRNDFPIRGLVNCGACGHVLTAAWCQGRKKKYPYYQCVHPTCPMKSKTIPKRIIEEQFTAFLKEKEVPDEVVEYNLAIYDDAWAQEVMHKDEKNVMLREEIAGYEEEINSLVEGSAKTSSQVVREHYERRIERLSNRITDIQKELEERPVNYPVSYRTALETVLHALKSPYAAWQSWDLRTKHKMFYFLFEDKLEYVKNEGYRTPKISIGLRVLEGKLDSKTETVHLHSNTLNQLVAFVDKWYLKLVALPSLRIKPNAALEKSPTIKAA